MGLDEADFLANVQRLMELKELEEHIAREQAEIRAEIAAFLGARGATVWNGQVHGQSVKVTRQERAQITYNEPLLRERLGERYRLVLGLDRKAVTAREDEILQWLGDRALEVARVDRNKVKSALEAGTVSPDEFRGAFERKVSYTAALQVMGGKS